MTEIPNRNLNKIDPGKWQQGQGRRRRYPHVEYGPTEIDENVGDHYTNRKIIEMGGDRPFPQEQTDLWRRQAGRFRHQPTSLLFHPTPNGWNDPLSVAMILDCLLRLTPTRYVSAVQLTAILQREYKMLLWDQRTVGKILSDLHSWAQLAEKNRGAMAPIERVTWNGSRQYVLDWRLVGWDWLGQAREYFGQQATATINLERDNQIVVPRTDEVWDGLAKLHWSEHLAGQM